MQMVGCHVPREYDKSVRRRANLVLWGNSNNFLKKDYARSGIAIGAMLETGVWHDLRRRRILLKFSLTRTENSKRVLHHEQR